MKKIFALILSMLLIVSLAACGEDDVEISEPPVFQSLTVDGQAPIQGGEQVAFPYEKNAEFTLELEFSNPDNVEFNTVQINGTTYRAHRFSNESTSNSLILNLNAGRIPDETSFEVEEIEYIDEEGVKSIDISENNVYTIFVMRGAPTGNFSSVSAFEESLEFEVALSDEDDTLQEATVELIKEEDDTVVSSMLIEDNYLSNTFTDLLSDSSYYLRVTADYETDDPDVDGDMVTDEVIVTSETYTTALKDSPTASVENDVASETSYEFDIDFTDISDVLVGDTLHLEVEQVNEDSENTIIDTRDVSTDALEDIRFDSLYNNNEYTIYIYADYDLNDGEGERENALLAQTTFTTPKRQIEDITTEALESTENRLVIGVDATELYDSVVVDSMRIIATDSESGETLKSSGLLSEQPKFEITKLYANQTIDIEIEVTYDLEDGQDLRTEVLHESSFTTSTNSAPSGTVESVDPVQGGLGFSINLNDPDNTVVPGTLRALIYEDDGTGLTLVDTYVLDETLSNFLYETSIDYENTYSVELITDYNLRDNTPTTEDYELDASYVSGDAKPKDPVGIFNAITPTKDGVQIDYSVLDDDATIVTDGIEISVNGTTTSRDTLEDAITFDGLLSGETYDVAMNITYDLDDGEGEQTVSVTETFTTE
ncbi:MAG: lipoprotein, partial [Bacillota bacterium]